MWSLQYLWLLCLSTSFGASFLNRGCRSGCFTDACPFSLDPVHPIVFPGPDSIRCGKKTPHFLTSTCFRSAPSAFAVSLLWNWEQRSGSGSVVRTSFLVTSMQLAGRQLFHGGGTAGLLLLWRPFGAATFGAAPCPDCHAGSSCSRASAPPPALRQAIVWARNTVVKPIGVPLNAVVAPLHAASGICFYQRCFFSRSGGR